MPVTRAPARKLLASSELRPKLARMENSFVTRWLLLVIAGAAFCAIGPVVVGSIIWLKGIGESHRTWLATVCVTALWFLPILFLIEWATRGKMLEEGAQTLGVGARPPV